MVLAGGCKAVGAWVFGLLRFPALNALLHDFAVSRIAFPCHAAGCAG